MKYQNIKSMYLCGPTLHSGIHIGNARSLVVFDEIFKNNKDAIYARNITDVDDNILKLSNHVNPADWVTENTLDQYKKDCAFLGLDEPTFEPRASDYIDEMVALIKNIPTIKSSDGIYFNTPADSMYGSLSNRKTYKPFCVWKFSSVDEWGWETDIGYGRPGWHTECAAMINSIFNGQIIDLHGGGSDLKFPHHENEVAQCRCSNGHNLAKSWVHVGTVKMDGEKMSKSLGNVMSISDVSKDFSGPTVREALLMTKPTKPFSMTWNRLREAEKRISNQPPAT